MTGPSAPDSEGASDWLFRNSSGREKLLEHLFVGELLRCLWRRAVRDAEVLRCEVDSAGYDLVLECNRIVRHVQLKSSTRKASTSKQDINVKLAQKPSGCVVWIKFDPDTLSLGPFLWFGGAAGAPLPDLGRGITRHTKANSKGVKSVRAGLRRVPKGRFEPLETMEEVARALFGIKKRKD